MTRGTASVAAETTPVGMPSSVVPMLAARPGGALTVSVVEGSKMNTRRRAGQRALALMAALVAVLVVASVPSTASAQDGVPTLEWFGWSHFRLTSTTGKIIHTNPFTTNPDTTVSVDDINKVDLILVADGHGDEVGQTVDIVKKTNAMVFA